MLQTHHSEVVPTGKYRREWDGESCYHAKNVHLRRTYLRVIGSTPGSLASKSVYWRRFTLEDVCTGYARHIGWNHKGISAWTSKGAFYSIHFTAGLTVWRAPQFPVTGMLWISRRPEGSLLH